VRREVPSIHHLYVAARHCGGGDGGGGDGATPGTLGCSSTHPRELVGDILNVEVVGGDKRGAAGGQAGVPIITLAPRPP
jgi:hypothetical protein